MGVKLYRKRFFCTSARFVRKCILRYNEFLMPYVNRHKFTVFSLVALFFFLCVPNVFAGTGITIQPIKVSHTLNPGEEAIGVISLTNASGDDEVIITLKAEDFVPAAGGDGVNFIGRAPGVTTVMDWITLGSDGEHEFRLKGGESMNVPYRIKAPGGAEPGGHFGVLFFQANRAAENQQLNVGTRIGVLVLVTIPGNNLQKGRILDFSTKTFYQKPPIDFFIRFENTGTVHFEPKGTIKITNIFRKKVGEVPVQGQIVLPTGVRNLTAKWGVGGLLLGKYKAELSIVDGEGTVLTGKSISFYVFPGWYLAEVFGAVLFAYLALRYARKKVKINISIR